MKYQTDKNYKPLKLSGVAKWAPTIFLAGALTYTIIAGFREGWNSASKKPNLETKIENVYDINDAKINMEYKSGR